MMYMYFTHPWSLLGTLACFCFALFGQFGPSKGLPAKQPKILYVYVILLLAQPGRDQCRAFDGQRRKQSSHSTRKSGVDSTVSKRIQWGGKSSRQA